MSIHLHYDLAQAQIDTRLRHARQRRIAQLVRTSRRQAPAWRRLG
jgi:hypothetical protein